MERLKSVMELFWRSMHDGGGCTLDSGKLNCR